MQGMPAQAPQLWLDEATPYVKECCSDYQHSWSIHEDIVEQSIHA